MTTLPFRIAAACWLLASTVAVADPGESDPERNWPQWRGAKHDGISREGKAPVHFSKTENLAWKLAIPNRAGATPVVWDDHIFLTSPAEDDDTLLLICVSTSGKVLWKKEMGKGNRNARSTRERAIAASRPATIPLAINRNPSPKIRFRISRFAAPTAARIASSRRRAATESESTP